MINYFKTEAEAKAYLISKGFKNTGNDHWVSSCSLIDAWLVTDSFRGTYIQFILK